MIIPDVNVLVYAEVATLPQHPAARTWWKKALEGTEAIGLPAVVLFGFVRITTNPRASAVPLAPHVAIGRVETWLARPHVRVLDQGPSHHATVFALLREVGTGGNLTTDAQIAAYAIENRGTVYSHDADYARFGARFGGIQWVDPITPKRGRISDKS